MGTLTIAGRPVGGDAAPYVIAEIGANHNGDMALCRRHIDAAAACGADAVKFQSWTSESLISRAEYERNTRYATDPGAPTLEEAVRQYELDEAKHEEIAAYCRDVGITFFSSCFSWREVEMLERLEVPAYKVASMDVNHLPLLDAVAATGKPVILSAGMATLGEIERALHRLERGGAGPVVLLHCVSVYPTPAELVHLRTMETYRAAFGVPVGYSDHTLGTHVPLAAVALGACMIEKHFTVDRTLPGWDHAISADPAELTALVEGSRQVHAALGSAARRVGAEEMAKRASFRRRMIATRSLRAGETVAASDVDFKRPGNGIAPDELDYVIGRRVARDIGAEEEVAWADLA